MRASGIADVDPFFVAGGPIGCLLLHGFTGTPHEMRFLGECLAAQGHSVSGIRLAGHATRLDDFERCTWADWYASARAGLTELQQTATPVVVVGQSMGSLLALKLAAEFPDTVVSVAVLSPALVLANHWLRWIGPMIPFALPLLPARYRSVGKGVSDIADPTARAASPNYRHVPLRAAHQLLQLQGHVRGLLPRVRQPVLVLHARQDHTCPLENVNLITAGVGGPVRARLLVNSYHVISVDVEKETVADEVIGFVAATAGMAARGTTPPMVGSQLEPEPQ